MLLVQRCKTYILHTSPTVDQVTVPGRCKYAQLYKFRHELVQRIQTGQFPLPTHLSKLAVEQVRYLTECWRQQLPSNGPMQPLGRYAETTHAMQVRRSPTSRPMQNILLHGDLNLSVLSSQRC